MSNNRNKLKSVFNPKVSIIIPVYNGSDYLKEAIDSALAQTYKNTEIIVVNDGSKDNGKTENIALSYGNKIRYFNKENGGVATALNFGIKEMKGEYFSWLSHDDLFCPQKTEIQINEISKLTNKEVFIFTDFEIINENNQFIKYFKVDEDLRNKFGLSIIFNQINGCTVLIHRNILQVINGFDEQYRTTQDYNTWINIFKNKCDKIHIQDFLVKSRIHSNQGTKTMRDVAAKEIYDIEKRYISELVLYYPSYFSKIRQHYKSTCDELYYSFLKFILKNENSISKILVVRYWLFLSWIRKIHIKIGRGNISKALSTKAYLENLWGDEQSRSGPGSNLENTSGIRIKIPELLKKYKIKTIVDAPCGDFYWMKEVIEKNIDDIDLYTGIDIVEELIQNNKKKYTSGKISFLTLDLTRDLVPKADLIICRDCFLHLSYRNIYYILRNFIHSGSKYLLVSSYINHKNVNVIKFDLPGRAINLGGNPFKINNQLDLINENYLGQNGEYIDKSLLFLDISRINITKIYLRVLANEIFFIPRVLISKLSKKFLRKTKRLILKIIK